MAHYIVLTKIHAKRIQKESLLSSRLPKSDLMLLAEKLNASFLKQYNCSIRLVDRACSLLSGTPENWAFARAIAAKLKPDDVVFCPGEEIGIPLASILSCKPKRPKMIVWFHRITGLRSRIALKIFKISRGIDLAVVCSRLNQVFLQNHLKLKQKQVLFWFHPINTNYFSSKTSKTSKTHRSRPLIMSVGLEQRDYRLLAAATSELNVDVEVAGFSKFQSVSAKCFPRALPANMSNQKYSVSELVKLYHSADMVAVCLRENNGTSGVTVLLEAMSCGKAIVCTHTKGLNDYLDDKKAVMSIKTGDVRGLQAAILHLLNNPQEARSRGQLAQELAIKRHCVENQVEDLAKFIGTV